MAPDRGFGLVRPRQTRQERPVGRGWWLDARGFGGPPRAKHILWLLLRGYQYRLIARPIS